MQEAGSESLTRRQRQRIGGRRKHIPSPWLRRNRVRLARQLR